MSIRIPGWLVFSLACVACDGSADSTAERSAALRALRSRTVVRRPPRQEICREPSAVASDRVPDGAALDGAVALRAQVELDSICAQEDAGHGFAPPFASTAPAVHAD